MRTHSNIGSLSYENWKAQSDGSPFVRAFEYPLFSDADICGEIIEGLGPYKLINAVPGMRRTPGLVRPALVLRADIHVEYEASKSTQTDASRYHGGSLQDEIAALASLALGVRIKAGDESRLFEPGQDPRGLPMEWKWRPSPVIQVATYGLILPGVVSQRSLGEHEPLSLLAKLTPADSVALVRVARLYQDAIWISESEPSLSWTMLVSAVETAANHLRETEDSPLERLRALKPELVKFLDSRRIDGLSARVAEYIADCIGSTKKFADFVTDSRFLPPPPPRRPPDAQRLSWDKRSIDKALRKVYLYRSKMLHDGRPFPAPMCLPPQKRDAWDAPEEKPTWLAAESKGSRWSARDIPLFLHTFEYIVRGALLKWWRTMASD